MTPPRDLSIFMPIPAGEATELPGGEGWFMWQTAVQLQCITPQMARDLLAVLDDEGAL